MPCLQVKVSIPLTVCQKQKLLTDLTNVISTNTGKPAKYIMVIIEDNVSIQFGDSNPCAFLDFRSIGCISAAENKKNSACFCEALKSLGINPDKVYINFTCFNRENWGYNGCTF